MSVKMSQENFQNMDDMEKAQRLRKEAALLEYRERVRGRLRQLKEISKDPVFDKYLIQMMKDLESGKASPEQVESVAERCYQQYCRQSFAPERPHTAVQRPAQGQKALTEKALPEKAAASVSPQRPSGAVEYKIGAQFLSMVGAIFVLAAFIIFGYNFLHGIWQGLCLYGAALVLMIFSQLPVLFKRSSIRNVIAGIGIGGLYIANIMNYLVLHSINGAAAMGIALVIAMVAVFMGRRKDSAGIRAVSLMGCYICLFPARGMDTPLEFLVIAMILFIVNVAGVFFQNQSHKRAINVFQLVLNFVFTLLYTGIAWARGIGTVYLVFYVVLAFGVNSLISLRHCRQGENPLFVLSCVSGGLLIAYLALICGGASRYPLGGGNAQQVLFADLIGDALVILVCALVYLFWNHEDGRKWAQLYYAAEILLLSGTAYQLEMALVTLGAFLVIKFLGNRRELAVLDCIVTVVTALKSLSLLSLHGWEQAAEYSYVYFCVMVAVLFLSVFTIRRYYLFHEIFISVYLLIAGDYVLGRWQVLKGAYFIQDAALLLLLFLLFNHVPWLKDKKQFPYNVFNVVVAGFGYLLAGLVVSYAASTVMMILGTVAILLVFRKRYGMAIPKKYMVLSGFLTFFVLAGGYPSPVIVSLFLMLIALLSVGIGFRINDKGERICGLTLAIFVCIKLVLYDFREVAPLYRVIVFLAVGVLALGISFLYIRLEKKLEEQVEV